MAGAEDDPRLLSFMAHCVEAIMAVLMVYGGMRTLLFEQRAREILGEPYELAWQHSPPPNVTYPEHIRGLFRQIEFFLRKIEHTLRCAPEVTPPPDYLIASPQLMCVLDAVPIFEDLHIWAPFKPVATSIPSGRSSLKIVRTSFDDRDFPLGPGEGWFTYADYHFIVPGHGRTERQPALPVATVQIEECREHPLQRLARCAE